MKKLVMVVGILLTVIALMVGAFNAGVYHAMVDSEFWVLEYDAGTDGYDYIVHVNIDNNWYEHGIYVG